MTDETPDDPAAAPESQTDPPDGSASESAVENPLARERDELYDRLLRTTAEFDNYRKRVERERREGADRAVIDLLLGILGVADDLDRALTVEADESAQPYRKGVELIHAKLHELLRKHGVRPMDTIGQDFDPNVHEAVAYEATPGARDGEIVAEMQRGYLRNDRLLRPATVRVARA
jgi:molecular chaperone GrpE